MSRWLQSVQFSLYGTLELMFCALSAPALNLNTVKGLECGAGYCLFRTWLVVRPHWNASLGLLKWAWCLFLPLHLRLSYQHDGVAGPELAVNSSSSGVCFKQLNLTAPTVKNLQNKLIGESELSCVCECVRLESRMYSCLVSAAIDSKFTQ